MYTYMTKASLVIAFGSLLSTTAFAGLDDNRSVYYPIDVVPGGSWFQGLNSASVVGETYTLDQLEQRIGPLNGDTSSGRETNVRKVGTSNNSSGDKPAKP